MREIKFRVWDKSHKQFLPAETYNIHNRTSFSSFGVMRKDWNNYSEGEYFYDIDQVLEQFTGLKDKNGVDIYEGDIVTTRTLSDELNDLSFKNYQVGFFECTFCLIKNDQAIRQWKDGTHDWYSLENTESFEIEVIGNIHENNNQTT
jgi:uncharacterized phage protein (TIGR01671 family)|tara:strand:- start:19239 stop:19679 length:441 start_codon:yes stop_codon:yes gene_type:complete